MAKCKYMIRGRCVSPNKHCPKGIGKNCNIIAKPRLVKIRAWAWCFNDILNGVCANNIRCLEKNRVPCHIVLKASDLAKIKEAK